MEFRATLPDAASKCVRDVMKKEQEEIKWGMGVHLSVTRSLPASLTLVTLPDDELFAICLSEFMKTNLGAFSYTCKI